LYIHCEDALDAELSKIPGLVLPQKLYYLSELLNSSPPVLQSALLNRPSLATKSHLNVTIFSHQKSEAHTSGCVRAKGFGDGQDKAHRFDLNGN